MAGPAKNLSTNQNTEKLLWLLSSVEWFIQGGNIIIQLNVVPNSNGRKLDGFDFDLEKKQESN